MDSLNEHCIALRDNMLLRSAFLYGALAMRITSRNPLWAVVILSVNESRLPGELEKFLSDCFAIFLKI